MDSFLVADWTMIRNTWKLCAPADLAIPYLAGVSTVHGESSVSSMLQRLLDAQAFPGRLSGYRFSSPEEAVILEELKQRGMLEVQGPTDMAQDPRDHWFFSPKGMRKLSFGVELPLEKQIAIEDIRRGMPLEDLTSYELILMLNDGGWTWRPLTPRAKALSHDLVASPRELVWFSGAATQREYLLALLKGLELHEQYGITLILHYAKPKV